MSQKFKNFTEVSGNEFLAVVHYSKIQEYFNSLEFVERKKQFRSNDDTEIFKIILNKLQEYFSGFKGYKVSFVQFENEHNRGLVKQVCLVDNSNTRTLSLGHVGVSPGFLSEYIISFFDNNLEKIITIITE